MTEPLFRIQVAVVNFTTKNDDIGLFAVFEKAIPASQSNIQAIVTQKLGEPYRLEGATSLSEMGFSGWPITPGGKFDYRDLRSAIESGGRIA